MTFEFLDVSPLVFVASFIVAIIAAIPQALLGMDFGLFVASSFLLIAPTMVPASVLVMSTVSAALNAVLNFRSINTRELGSSLIGRLVGVLLAFVMLSHVQNRDTFSVVIANLILLAVMVSAVKIAPRRNTRTLLLAGAASGISGTITSIGAPPMGLVYQNAERKQASATLNAFFAFGGVLSAIAVWFYGWLNWNDVFLAAALLPGNLFGTWLSQHLRGFIDQRYKNIVL